MFSLGASFFSDFLFVHHFFRLLSVKQREQWPPADPERRRVRAVCAARLPAELGDLRCVHMYFSISEKDDDVYETSAGVDVVPSFDGMGLKDKLLQGIYNYGTRSSAIVLMLSRSSPALFHSLMCFSCVNFSQASASLLPSSSVPLCPFLRAVMSLPRVSLAQEKPQFSVWAFST